MRKTDIEQIADAVTDAPSIFDSRPWYLQVPADDRIDLHLDLRELGEEERGRWGRPGRDGTRHLDPLAREFAISCGAALFNLRLVIRVAGHDLTVRLPAHRTRESTLLASVEIVTDKVRPPTITEQELYEAIWRLHTSRRPYAPLPLPIIVAMENAAFQEGASLRLLHRAQARKWIHLATAADRYLETESDGRPRVTHERYQRNQEHQHRSTGSGNGGVWVPGAALGPAPVGGSPTGKAVRRPDEKLAFERRPQLMVLSAGDDQLLDWLRAGQGLQHAILVGTRYSASSPYGVAAYQAPLRRAVPARHHLPRRHHDLAYDGLSVSFLVRPIERHDIEHEDARVKRPRRPMPRRFAELPRVVVRVGYAVHQPDDPAPRRQPDVLDTRLQPLDAGYAGRAAGH